MPASWRTVRVFISSTFWDMQAERDWLVKRVFPALRQRLEAHRIYLVDIDLRWGLVLSDAQEKTQHFARVVELCLGHIEPGKPFFVCLLGDRYGTPVETDAIPNNSPVSWVRYCKGSSLTELEILHGVLNVTGAKDHAFFYFREPIAVDTIPASQRELYEETDPALRARSAALKAKLRDPMKGYHITEYLAHWDSTAYNPISKTHGRLRGLEEFGNAVLEQLWSGIKREHNLPDTPTAFESQTDTATDAGRLAEGCDFHERFIENRTRLYIGREQLQDELQAFVLGTEKLCLITGPSGSGKSAALAKFVGVWRMQHPQEVAIPHFIGASHRSTSLREMLRRLCQEIYEKCDLEEKKRRKLAAIDLGSEEEQRKQREAIEREFEIKQDARELSDQFRDFLGKVPANRRVLLVLDALDQLDQTDNAHSLYWLPTQMPPQVRIMVSCIDDPDRKEQQPALAAIRSRKPHEIPVGELSDEERRAILSEVPSIAAKTLDEIQTGLLLANPATKNPLYLLVLLEELRGFGSFHELDLRIVGLPHQASSQSAFDDWLKRARDETQSKPSLTAEQRTKLQERLGRIESAYGITSSTDDTLSALFRQVIKRLGGEESKDGTRQGGDFDGNTVKEVLTLLACARHGLSERELLDLIEGESVHIGKSRGDLFPILRQLRPYLQSRGPLLDFYHRHLAKACCWQKCDLGLRSRGHDGIATEDFRQTK